MATPRFVAEHILEAAVLDVTLATSDVIDARGFTHIYVYPDSGGSVKWSVVVDDAATVHGPNPVTGGTDVIQEIVVAGNFYLIEAITADCHAHPIFLNISDLEVDDEGSALSIAVTKLDFAGAGVTATEPVTNEILVTIPGSPLSVEDEGSELSPAALVLDFVGVGVKATEPSADNIQITIDTGKIDFVRRTAGDLTLNSTTWANLPSLGTLVLDAEIGDVVEVGMGGSFGTEAIDAFLDAGSDDSGIQNVWSLDGSEVAAGNGVQAWKGGSGSDHGFGGSSRRTLVTADIVTGQVTIQFRYKTASASNRTLKADSNNPLEVWAKNHGPVEV